MTDLISGRDKKNSNDKFQLRVEILEKSFDTTLTADSSLMYILNCLSFTSIVTTSTPSLVVTMLNESQFQMYFNDESAERIVSKIFSGSRKPKFC